MKNIFFGLVLGLLFTATNLYGQNDAKAEQLLNDSYEQLAEFTSIKAGFTFELINEQEHIRQKSEGVLHSKDSKYHIYLGDIERLFDGQYIYTIMTEDEEVNIELPGESEDIFSTPQELLDKYRKNYTVKLDILQPLTDGRKIQFLRLQPLEQDEQVSYILIGIDQKSKNLHSVIEVGSNKTTTTFEIKDLVTNANIGDSEFIFNKQKYEDAGYFINDPE